jgi:PKD repeat protein
LVAGSPITFTIGAAPGANSTAQIRNVAIDFGDGTRRDLGAVQGTALSVSTIYNNAGTFTVTLTVTDTLGFVTTGATVIVVLPQPPLSVTILVAQTTSGQTTLVTFTATVTPSTATVSSYLWNFGDGTSPQVTTGPQVTHNYPVGTPRTVTLTVTTTTGQTADTSTVVNP